MLPTTASDLESLRQPGERKLLRRTVAGLALVYVICTGLTLMVWVGWFILACLTVMVLRSRYPSMALEVSPEQLPEVHALVGRCADTLGVKPPRVFVSWDPGTRPVFTVPLPEPAIMLSASWIKMLDSRELAFFLYKELAHGKLGHRFVLNPVNVLENVGPVSWILTTPLEIARYCLRPWQRLADFSADRYALACLDGDLEVVASALAKVTAGEEIYEEVSGPAFLEQCRRLRPGWGLWLLEVTTGRIGFGSRLEKLVRFAETPEFPALCQGQAPAPRPGLLARARSFLSGAPPDPPRLPATPAATNRPPDPPGPPPPATTSAA